MGSEGLKSTQTDTNRKSTKRKLEPSEKTARDPASKKKRTAKDVSKGTISKRHEAADLPVRTKTDTADEPSSPIPAAKEEFGDGHSSSLDAANSSLATRSSHKRFDGDDQDEGAPNIEDENLQQAEESGGSSDEDESPEAVSLSQGAKLAEERAKGMADAATSQQEAAKQKRRKQTKRLQEQAESSRLKKASSSKKKKKKTKQVAPADESESTSNDESSNNEASSSSKRSKLPLPLPDELLAEEADESTSLVALSAASTTVKKPSKKQIFDTTAPRKTKAVRKSGVQVRVLESRSGFLAPRANRASFGLKENWLQGRVGVGGRMRVERRPVVEGRRPFVRKTK